MQGQRHGRGPPVRLAVQVQGGGAVGTPLRGIGGIGNAVEAGIDDGEVGIAVDRQAVVWPVAMSHTELTEVGAAVGDAGIKLVHERQARQRVHRAVPVSREREPVEGAGAAVGEVLLFVALRYALVESAAFAVPILLVQPESQRTHVVDRAEVPALHVDAAVLDGRKGAKGKVALMEQIQIDLAVEQVDRGITAIIRLDLDLGKGAERPPQAEPGLPQIAVGTQLEGVGPLHGVRAVRVDVSQVSRDQSARGIHRRPGILRDRDVETIADGGHREPGHRAQADGTVPPPERGSRPCRGVHSAFSGAVTVPDAIDPRPGGCAASRGSEYSIRALLRSAVRCSA